VWAFRILICGLVVINLAVTSSDFKELIEPAALGAGCADELTDIRDVGLGLLEMEYGGGSLRRIAGGGAGIGAGGTGGLHGGESGLGATTAIGLGIGLAIGGPQRPVFSCLAL